MKHLSRSLAYPWVIVALLLPVAMLNYLDRQMIASMQKSVMADIPSIENKANWGYMLAKFKWVYALLSPIGGLIADRLSRRWTIFASLFVWSAVTCWTSQVTTYTELVWSRSLMGFSEAFYIPAALALIADYHSNQTRSRAIGLHQMAIYVGVIVGGFGGYVADEPALGWRWAFQMCGIVGMIYAVPLVLLLRDPATPATDETGDSSQGALGVLLGNRSFWLLVLYFTLPAICAWIFRDWLPNILQDQFNIGQGRAGVTAVLYWQVTAIGSAVLGGYLADRWMQRTPRGRIYISAIGMSLIVPAIFGVGNAPTLGIAIAFLILFGIGWGFFDGNNMPILSQLAAPRDRATGYGIMNLVSISCGGFADWSFGLLRDQNVPINVIFTYYALLAIVSIGLVLMIRVKKN